MDTDEEHNSVWGMASQFNFNQTDRTMTWKENGAQFMFSGLDDVEKLKIYRGRYIYMGRGSNRAITRRLRAIRFTLAW